MAKRKRVKKSKTHDETLNFESAMLQLEAIVADLENGDLGLDQSLARYEQGVQHLKQCFDMLSHAEKRISVLTGVDADGNPVGTVFEDEYDDLQEKAASRSQRRSARGATPRAAANRMRDESSEDGSSPDVIDDASSLF